MFLSLPNEIKEEIFQHLDLDFLLWLMLTCREMYRYLRKYITEIPITLMWVRFAKSWIEGEKLILSGIIEPSLCLGIIKNEDIEYDPCNDGDERDLLLKTFYLSFNDIKDDDTLPIKLIVCKNQGWFEFNVNKDCLPSSLARNYIWHKLEYYDSFQIPDYNYLNIITGSMRPGTKSFNVHDLKADYSFTRSHNIGHYERYTVKYKDSPNQ